MIQLFKHCLVLFSIFLFITSTAYSVKAINDEPENFNVFSIDESVGAKDQPSNESPQTGISIDDLLGPEDVFPFRPDNHRDSGTGKFNSF